MRSINKFRLVLLVLICSAPLRFFGQTNDSLEKTISKINHFFTSEDWYMELEYSEKKRNQSGFVIVSEGSVEKKGESKRTIFKDEDVLANDSVYVKVDRIKKQIYFIRGNQAEDVGETDKGVMQVFNEEQLKQYKLQFNQTASRVDSGYLVYSGIEGSAYHSIQLQLNKATLLPSSYTIKYAEWASSDREAIKIDFKTIKKLTGSEKMDFQLQSYFQIDGNQVTTSKTYKDYKLIKNF